MASVRPQSDRVHWEILRHFPLLSWAILTLIVICSVITFSVQNSIRDLRISSRERELVSVIDKRITEKLKPMIVDLLMIADEPTLLSLLDHPSPGNRQILEDRLLWWSGHAANYYKIRVLDASGKEIVRINHLGDHSYPVAPGDLENKSDRYFFKETLPASKGQVFISPFDLNVDKGVIETPIHPTIRVCTPIFNSKGQKMGIIMLNYEGQEILNEVVGNPGSSAGQIQLLNSAGYWLKGPSPADEWGFLYPGKEDRTFARRDPEAWEEISRDDTGFYHDSQGLFVFSTVHPLNAVNGSDGLIAFSRGQSAPGPYVWKVVSRVPETVMLTESRDLVSWIVIVDVLIVVPLLILSRKYALIHAQRRRAEDALRQQAAMLDLAEDAIYLIDYKTRLLRFWNKGATKQFGWSKEEAVGSDVVHLLKSRFPIPLEQLQNRLLSNDDWEGEVAHQTRTGEWVISICRAAVQRDATGAPATVLIINHNIGAIKKAEAELRKVHTETELFFNAIPSLLIGLNPEGRIVRWNPATEATFILANSHVSGKTLAACGIQWVDPSQVDKSNAELGGEEKRLDRVAFVRNGEKRFLGLKMTKVAPNGDGGEGLLIVGADLTERIELESQLRQAQKLEAIGQLAAGIAHEINTPTQYIGDNMVFVRQCWDEVTRVIELARKMRADADQAAPSPDLLKEFDAAWQDSDVEFLLDEVPRAIGQSQDGLRRASKIVGAMKEFSHPGSEEKQSLDINRAIESTVTIASNEWKYVANVETNLDATLPQVSCLAGEFNQVVLNLLVNAAHAIADTNNQGEGDKGAILITTKHDAEWAEICIRDSGAGIPKEVQGRIFEPFFTTKEIGKGTGQGLALAHSVIVKKHAGQIWFTTEEGKGTSFFIRIPIAGRPA